jgi:DNA-binding transcriptional regulator YhcF (GntR family)
VVIDMGLTTPSIDPRSGVPPYEQVRSQVALQVRSGRLAAGTRMPTVRALAEQLGLAANTVAKAYRELESDGVLETRGRAGSFIRAADDAAEQQAQVAARAYADRIRRLGLSRDAAIALVAQALED